MGGIVGSNTKTKDFATNIAFDGDNGNFVAITGEYLDWHFETFEEMKLCNYYFCGKLDTKQLIQHGIVKLTNGMNHEYNTDLINKDLLLSGNDVIINWDHKPIENMPVFKSVTFLQSAMMTMHKYVIRTKLDNDYFESQLQKMEKYCQVCLVGCFCYFFFFFFFVVFWCFFAYINYQKF